MEEELYEIASMRQFAGLSLAHAAATPYPSPYWPGPRPGTCPKKV